MYNGSHVCFIKALGAWPISQEMVMMLGNFATLSPRKKPKKM
jgi:hypothetical protein